MDVKALGMQIARQQAALAWQGKRTSGKRMDPELAEEFAHIVYHWICNAKGAAMALEYYRGLLSQCDQILGGTQEAVYANVPVKVQELLRENVELLAAQVKENKEGVA